FRFKNYYETTAFVNGAAWIAHREDHHADIRFGYRECEISYTTHAIGGLSDNDFICAAKINALLD
ncbi:MAG: 4a-hydroxytetrahydrobiopterin dehydratase, partial [Gammaproteobacteria bacterium]|nr:4a-hydroxytetrahydrobiopterin dehydratase [Gammaproteobacteria bacterium]